MSSLAASNGDEPPQKKLQPSSLFSSLPRDMVVNILARVPKRYYPIISCVSKNLRSLVKSSDINKTRSLLGKDYLYICFLDEPIHDYWYTLRRLKTSSTTENLLESIDFSYLPDPCGESKMIAVGTEIFFVPGYDPPSSTLWILDTRSGEWRQGPSSLVKRMYNCTGLVGGKIYVIGGCKDDEMIPAERFDLKTQTWEAAPFPDELSDGSKWVFGKNVSFDRKVCALSSYEGMMTCYDTRDGSCESSKLPDDEWWKTGVCVIDNVLYVYFSRLGLMWYDSESKVWRVVSGLDLGKPESVAMAEYYGKLAFLWVKPSLVSSQSKEIWCRMIGLVRSQVYGINGTAEPSQLLGNVPHGYQMCLCLSISG